MVRGSLWGALAFCFGSLQICFASTPAVCVQNLESLENRSEAFRHDVIRASLSYGLQFKNRRISLFRGNEFEILKPKSVSNAHALYIGAGGDIWRLMADFPEAKHYHMLDRMTGWGDSPQHLFLSIKHRLENLASKVEIIQKGFIENLGFSGIEVLRSNTDALLQKIESSDLPVTNPVIFRLEILSPTLGRPVVKYVWLHLFDYAVHDHYVQVLDSIRKEEPILGCLQAVLAGTPYAESLSLLLDRMTPEAPYLLELTGKSLADHQIESDADRPKLEQTLKGEFSDFLKRTDLVVTSTPLYKPKHGPSLVVILRKS